MTAPSVPAPMQYILLPAYVGFTNIMSCVVFRGMALGVYVNKDAAYVLEALDTETTAFGDEVGLPGGGRGRGRRDNISSLTFDSIITNRGGNAGVVEIVLEEFPLKECGAHHSV